MTRSTTSGPRRAPRTLYGLPAPPAAGRGDGDPLMHHTDDTDSAAALLRQLSAYFREHPVTGPVEGRAPTRAAPAPLSLATLDHVTQSVRELTDLTDAVNAEPSPLPRNVQDVYAWCVANTEHAPETTQQRRDTVIYRQYLEHAIHAGDWRRVIRPHRCPECRTFSLMWKEGRALCTKSECVDADGMSTTVTLARLAHEHVAARKSLRHVSAT
ncbi:hypothetical protein ACTWJ9_33320 (plasmid) [Streptomyces sp. GDS52]|uniref:hypothetical protein n=1 Tax=Streptomyces sp. GDS52 TaxID=3406419 RepID=UPI003FCFA904